MHIAEPLGVPGAPLETLNALTSSVTPEQLPGARLILLTDRQGERFSARYATLLLTGRGVQAVAHLSAPAFGPHFGEAGTQALAELAHWASSHGLPMRETVLDAPALSRLLADPDAAELADLVAASNPTDAGIYTTPPQKHTD